LEILDAEHKKLRLKTLRYLGHTFGCIYKLEEKLIPLMIEEEEEEEENN